MSTAPASNAAPAAAQDGTPARPRVLFAARDGGRPDGALLRAYAFARVLDGDLTVLRVSPAGGAVVPHLNIASALAELEGFTAASRSARSWCDEVLGEPLSDGNVLVREGDFEETVVRVALVVAADLVVLPPNEGSSGERVTAISGRTGASVLVVRRPRSHAIVVAATDMSDVRYPVLVRATDIAARLGADVVAVHNLSRRELDEAYQEEQHGRPLALEHELARRRHRLTELAERMGTDLEPVVASRSSAAEAILAAARDLDADLIMVGMRGEGELDVAQGTAAAVVESSCRSILVVPFRPRRSVPRSHGAPFGGGDLPQGS